MLVIEVQATVQVKIILIPVETAVIILAIHTVAVTTVLITPVIPTAAVTIRHQVQILQDQEVQLPDRVPAAVTAVLIILVIPTVAVIIRRVRQARPRAVRRQAVTLADRRHLHRQATVLRQATLRQEAATRHLAAADIQADTTDKIKNNNL